MRRIRGESPELYSLGRSLLSTLIAVIVVMGTTSSTSLIFVLYWSIVAMGAAFIRLVERQPFGVVETSIGLRSRFKSLHWQDD